MAYAPPQYGARLTAATRKKIPAKDFALPGGRYPIHDESHARNALSRGAQNASPSELATIKAKVRSKYPNIQVGAHHDMGWFRLPSHNRQNIEMKQYGARHAPGAPKKLPPDDKTTHFYAAGAVNPGGPGGSQAGARGVFPKSGPKGFHGAHTDKSLGGSGSSQFGARWAATGQVGARSKEKGEAGYQAGPRQGGVSAKTRQGTSTASSGAPPVDRFEKPGMQYGARGGGGMPSHMHALSMASATHLHRAGHIDKNQLKAIHSHAKNSMAAMRQQAAPPPDMPNPAGPGAAAPGGGMMQIPSFGSLSLGGGGGPSMGGSGSMQVGARRKW